METIEKYDSAPLIEVIKTGSPEWITPLIPDLIHAKNQAAFTLAKGRAAMRPMNTGVIKATEADRTIEMEAKTAALKQEYQNLSDLYDVCMELIRK
jgi:hypothetical protein